MFTIQCWIVSASAVANRSLSCLLVQYYFELSSRRSDTLTLSSIRSHECCICNLTPLAIAKLILFYHRDNFFFHRPLYNIATISIYRVNVRQKEKLLHILRCISQIYISFDIIQRLYYMSIKILSRLFSLLPVPSLSHGIGFVPSFYIKGGPRAVKKNNKYKTNKFLKKKTSLRVHNNIRRQRYRVQHIKYNI